MLGRGQGSRSSEDPTAGHQRFALRNTYGVEPCGPSSIRSAVPTQRLPAFGGPRTIGRGSDSITHQSWPRITGSRPASLCLTRVTWSAMVNNARCRFVDSTARRRLRIPSSLTWRLTRSLRRLRGSPVSAWRRPTVLTVATDHRLRRGSRFDRFVFRRFLSGLRSTELRPGVSRTAGLASLSSTARVSRTRPLPRWSERLRSLKRRTQSDSVRCSTPAIG